MRIHILDLHKIQELLQLLNTRVQFQNNSILIDYSFIIIENNIYFLIKITLLLILSLLLMLIKLKPNELQKQNNK